jgi:hypothetical protein
MVANMMVACMIVASMMAARMAVASRMAEDKTVEKWKLPNIRNFVCYINKMNAHGRALTTGSIRYMLSTENPSPTQSTKLV